MDIFIGQIYRLVGGKKCIFRHNLAVLPKYYVGTQHIILLHFLFCTPSV